jgi:lysophospholipase L1-like esterase
MHVPMEGVLHPALMAVDGFHPSPPLYARVAVRLSQYIVERVQTNG